MARALPITISISLILLQFSAVDAQTRANVSTGQSLLAETNGSTWVSPSGDFAFGFHDFNNRSDLFLLAIWYAKIPETIVWFANGGNPVPQGSTVTLTANEGLVLSDPRGSHQWNTSDDLRGSSVVSYGILNDTGNFALISNSIDNIVWQSFDHPTDTLLPSQVLDIGFEVNSQLTETNFTKGRFQLRLIPDGNLVLNSRELATGFANGAYYVTGTNHPGNAGQKLIYEDSGRMYILQKDGSRYDLLSSNKTTPAEDSYQRVTLNFDGVLTWYSIPRKSADKGWSPVRSLPDNICTTTGSPEPYIGSGICGYNSICSLGNDQRPTCYCPQNYSLVDPNDTYGSCKSDFILDECEEYAQRVNKGEFKLLHLPNTDWPYNGYARLYPSSEEDCQSSCLNDCFCAAAFFHDTADGNSGCWKKKGPLSNGRQDTTIQGTAWLKVGNIVDYPDDSLEPFIPQVKVKNKLNTAISVLLGGSVFVNLFLIGAIVLAIFFFYHKKPLKQFDACHSRTLREYSNVHCFSYQELREATNGFREELGRGAFGTVYKGDIRAGGSPISVAVKKLDRRSINADREFKTEVSVIGQTHHKNLVRLVGFCKEEDQRLLVYEYMSNGNLAHYLFNDLRPRWMARVEISIGIARGLLYLHEECSTQIIHCDIKPQNILLDDYASAHIADFGLAKLLVLKQSQTNTAIRGTRGYVAPEWFRNKPITVKVDVYSFGVLLLEIICCRKSICAEIVEEQAILTDWAFDCYQSGALDSLVNDDMEALNDRLRLQRFLMVALWCIQEEPGLRPTMRTVTHMLEGLSEVPNPPCPSLYSVTISS